MSPSSRGGAGRLAAVGAVAGGVVAAAYGAQRLATQRLRRRPDPHSAVQRELVADVDHELHSHDGGSIHVLESGTGIPIVFSHGVTLSARIWIRQFEALPREGLRVVAFDDRGHGASVAGDAGLTIESLAHDFRSVLEGLDLHDAVIVGHSMGGIAAQAFAVRHPRVLAERVAGMVLLSTIASTPLAVSGSAWLGSAVKWIAGVAPDTSVIWGARDLGLLVARIGFGRDAKASDVEMVRQMMLECPSETRRGVPGVILGVDLTDELPEIDVPTLVVCGSADVITPPWESRRIASLIPGARLELFERGGHMLMLEQPERFNDLVAAFARSSVSCDRG
ncbi:MAG: alpha/beta hydrolase [Acidimicrobiia bacterium]|nr:alpha/beta hydrolase [Acidimicrobiia bacterium]